MDLRNMRQLMAVRRHGSFAKAARALGMSQPSLSTAIARMEDQLKVKLFDRTSSGSHLTPIGELIADRSVKVIVEAEQIIRDAALVAGGEAGIFRLGVGTGLRQYMLGKLVLRLAENYPALSLNVQVLDRDRLLPMLLARELDLAICAWDDDQGEGDLVATEVIATEGVAVARPDHPLANEPRVSITRFSEFPAAGGSLKRFDNAGLLDLSDRRLAVSQYQSNDYEPMLDLALGGHATMIAPMFVVQPYLQAGTLKQVDLDWTFKVSFAAIATRAASYSPIVNRVVRHATAIGAELQA